MDCVISTLIILAILSLFILVICTFIFGGTTIRAVLGLIGISIMRAVWAWMFNDLLK
jgi:hypothetical protein